MKTVKSILLIASVLVATVAFSQPGKGDKLLIGNLSMNYDNHFDNKVKTDAYGGLNSELMLGVGIGKGYVLGGGIQYNNYFKTTFDLNGYKDHRDIMHSVGPVLFTRHFMRLADKFYLRMGTDISYLANMNRTKLYPSKDKTDIDFTNTFNIDVRLGLVIFPTPNIGLEFSYGELYYNTNFDGVLDGNPDVSNHVGFRYGVDGIQVGLVVVMKKKNKAAEKK